MEWIGAIVIGLLAGIVAKLVMPGKDPGGFIITTILGVVGALVATWIGQAIGWYAPGEAAGFMNRRSGRPGTRVVTWPQMWSPCPSIANMRQACTSLSRAALASAIASPLLPVESAASIGEAATRREPRTVRSLREWAARRIARAQRSAAQPHDVLRH